MKARWTRCVATASLAILPLAAAPSANAQECSSLGVTCIVDLEVNPQDTVDDPVGTVTDTVGPVVGDTLEEVDRVLGGGNEPPPPGGGGAGGGGGGGDGDGGGGPGGDQGAGGTDPGGSGQPLGLRSSIASGTPIESSEPVALDPRTSLRERFGTTIAGAAESLLVVTVLLGVAVAFVLIQNRIDRTDPRLTLAPIESDLVRFA